jgi:enterochelin esterase-like enzyme
VPGLEGARLVRVYLPRGYDRGAPHPVLYLFDGQNVFDDGPSYAGGWYTHQAVDGRATRARAAPIVVGIDHGHERRIAELTPFATEHHPARFDALLAWLTDVLVPLVASRYRVVPGAVGAAVGGSSLGGLAAFYAHFRRPDAFGGVIAMSPSFWVARGRVFAWFAGQPTPHPSRVYLDCGAREGRMHALAERMREALTARQYPASQLLYVSDPDGTHSEAAWRRRLPRALRFMYP